MKDKLWPLLVIFVNIADQVSGRTIQCTMEDGFCVKSNGADQNTGVIKLNSIDGNTPSAQNECLSACLSFDGATGCEVIWDQSNRGCYIHTKEVSRGNNQRKHKCWILSKCSEAIRLKTSRTCESDTMNLQCPVSSLVHIESAMYGRQSRSFCSGAMHTADCAAASSMYVARQRCEGKNSCQIPATNAVFGDPCVNTYKYLEVKWGCSGAISNSVYQTTIIPNLPAGSKVASIEDATLELFKQSTTYNEIILLSIIDVQNGGDVTSYRNEELRAVQCGSPVHSGFLGYFCMDHTTWTINTTTGYTPEPNSDFIAQFKIESTLKDSSKQSLSIHVFVQSPCKAQEHFYQSLDECRPRVSSETPEVFSEGLKYDISNSGIRYYLHSVQLDVNVFRRSVPTLGSSFFVDVFDNKYAVNLPSDHRTVNISIFKAVPKYSNDIVLKFFTEDEYLMSPSSSEGVALRVYDLKEFCGFSKCLQRFLYWKWLVGNIGEESRACVKDEFNMTTLYQSCYEPIMATISRISPASGVISERDAVHLRCSVTDTPLPASITWYFIKGGRWKTAGLNTDDFHIISASRTHWGAYMCRVTTPDPAYFTESKRMKIKIEGWLWIRISFRIDNLKFESRYENLLDGRTRDMMTKMRNAAFNSFMNSGLFAGRQPDLIGLELRNDSNSDQTWFVADLYVKKLSTKDNDIKISNHASKAIMNGAKGTYGNLFLGYSVGVVMMQSENACSKEETNEGAYKKYSVQWRATMINSTVRRECPENPDKYMGRTCNPARQAGEFAYWSSADLRNCTFKSKAEYKVEEVNETAVTSRNAAGKSAKLVDASTDDTGLGKPKVLASVVSMLTLFRNFIAPNTAVTDNIFSIVDNLMGAEQKVFAESQRQYNTTSRLLTFLADAGEAILDSEDYYVTSRQRFALGGIKTSVAKFENLYIDYFQDRDNQSHLLLTSDILEHQNMTKASIFIPENVAKKLPRTMREVKIVAVVMENSVLFPRTNDSEFEHDDWIVNSHVMSAEIRGAHVENLQEPIEMSFYSKDARLNNDRSCVFWQVHENDWSTNGCKTVFHNDDVSNRTKCQCNHLTNFAVLFAAKPPDNIHGNILTIVTYVGLAVSLVGAFITLITHIIFPMLRETIPPKILMNLCTALILMTILFLIGIEEVSSKAGCQAIAILLQYFFLAVFCWSAVEGFHSVRGLVFPMKAEISMFVQKACLFGWGTPAVLTAIGAGVWNEDYGSKDGCIVTNTSFYITTCAPVALIILANVIAMIAISVMVRKSTRRFGLGVSNTRQRIQLITSLTVLFCLTWLLGLLIVVWKNNVVLQYLFCSFCSLQGFYIFLCYCLRKETARFCWKCLLSGNTISSIKKLSAQRKQTFTTGLNPDELQYKRRVSQGIDIVYAVNPNKSTSNTVDSPQTASYLAYTPSPCQYTNNTYLSLDAAALSVNSTERMHLGTPENPSPTSHSSDGSERNSWSRTMHTEGVHEA